MQTIRPAHTAESTACLDDFCWLQFATALPIAAPTLTAPLAALAVTLTAAEPTDTPASITLTPAETTEAPAETTAAPVETTAQPLRATALNTVARSMLVAKRRIAGAAMPRKRSPCGGCAISDTEQFNVEQQGCARRYDAAGTAITIA